MSVRTLIERLGRGNSRFDGRNAEADLTSPEGQTGNRAHFHYVLCGFLVLAVVLGGATRPNAAGDTILQLLAVPFLFWVVWRWRLVPPGTAGPLGFIIASILLVLMQLVPLPPSVWTALPLRDVSVEALRVIGHEPGWRPLSMSPQSTMLSLLAVLPPLAVFLATAQQSFHERRRLVVVLLLAALMSCGLSLWQVANVAAGPGSSGGGASVVAADASGFFVNRNHLASFLAVAIVLAAVFALDAIKTLTLEPERVREPKLLTAIGAATLASLIFIGTIILARSRAGMLLAMLAIVAIAILARMDPRRSAGRTAFGLAIVAVVAILLPASQFALYRVMERFGEDPLSDGRAEIAPVVWSTIQNLLPFGSGLGTFVPVYKEVEEPSRALMGVFVNRAHNDYLELTMELGLPAVVLMAAFAVWLVRRLVAIWRRPDFGAPLDIMLARAAGIVIVIFLAHSAVDYPLRTAAGACIFAAACAMMILPRKHHLGGHRPVHADAVTAAPPPERARVASSEPVPTPVPRTEPVSATGRSKPNPPAAAPALEGLGRWPESWRPGAAAAVAPASDVPVPDAAAAATPTKSAPPSPAEPKRDLKDILEDQTAWPKEWQPQDKSLDKT